MLMCIVEGGGKGILGAIAELIEEWSLFGSLYDSFF